MAYNVLQIPEGGDYEAQNFKIIQMFNRSKNVHITTKAPLLGMCCYKPFFFTNQNKMTREQKLETIVKLFAKGMFYGDWKWETPNERVIEMLMKEVGYYPFKDEDEMIHHTSVDDNLYKQAIKEVEGRCLGNGDTEKFTEDVSENGL